MLRSFFIIHNILYEIISVKKFMILAIIKGHVRRDFTLTSIWDYKLFGPSGMCSLW